LRYSIPFFLEPRFDAEIKSIAGDKAGVVYGPWLIEKIQREYVEYAGLLADVQKDIDAEVQSSDEVSTA
jgi:hypothetical protein